MARGMTQGEIAQKLQCRQGYVSGLLTGKRGKRLGFDIGKRLEALMNEIDAENEQCA
jgi:transcriptional regulator with XRE-family HTH domain